MVYKKRTKKYTRKALGIRGGAFGVTSKRLPRSISDPLFNEFRKIIKSNASPERVRNLTNKIIDKAVSGKSATASRILKEMAKPLSLKVGEGLMRLTEAPSQGGSTRQAQNIPFIETHNYKRVSGSNQLYINHEHNIKFVAGNTSGSWLRTIAKTNGTLTRKHRDTSENYQLGNVTRSELISTAGANQKRILMINPRWFGFQNTEITPSFSLASYDTNQVRDQKAYGAISKLGSYMSFTNMNKLVPIKVKFYLLNNKIPSLSYDTAFKQTYNTTTISQDNGAIPVTQQISTGFTGEFYSNLLTDPLGKGVRGSDNFKANFDIIASKSIKLAAGDTVNLSYDHLFGSGIRLDVLYSMIKESSNYTSNPQITYSLMIEFEGIMVDAYLIADPNSVIKCTAPCAVQMEFKKTISGVLPSATGGEQHNTGSFNGYIASDFAVKVYTTSPTVGNIRRWSGSYSELNDVANPSGYRVPLMSPSFEADAGSVTAP